MRKSTALQLFGQCEDRWGKLRGHQRTSHFCKKYAIPLGFMTRIENIKQQRT